MDVTPEDRRDLDRLREVIDDPNTMPELRDACRDEFESIASGYIGNDIFTDEDVAAERAAALARRTDSGKTEA